MRLSFNVAPEMNAAAASQVKVLVLCTGNICRSPLAEAMLAAKLSDMNGLILSSAGVAAPVGVVPDALAVKTGRMLGYSISPQKRSRQVSTADLSLATMILVMEPGHKQYIRRKSPAAANKTFLFGEWIGGEIPDPIGRDEEYFRRVSEVMDRAAESWVPRIRGLSSIR